MPTATVSPRKAEIIRIAGELFAEKGFQGTSLRDIGQAVDLRRGSLYSHFSSKEEILKMLLAPAVEELIEVLDRVAAQPGNGREKLDRALSEAIACGRRHRNAILVLFQDRQLIEDSPVLREVSEAAKSITPKWLSFIAAGQGDGTIRADIAPATIVVALISLLVGALSDRHLGIYAAGEAPLASPEELGQVAATLIFEGIVPR
jgi:AcrR family transcriptional regulator